MVRRGIITKIISNQYTINCDNELFTCIPRGKFRNLKQDLIVGDLVEINPQTNTIENVLARNNNLDRPPVANIDIALIVTSVKKPEISLTLLDKLLSIITINKIKPIICLTKLDLCTKDELDKINRLRKYYQSIGYEVVDNTKTDQILKLLKNKIVVVTGQTGAGKSSLLNKLDTNLNLKTSPISDALGRGVHTTRHVEIFDIKGIHFVDTPGFSAIDFNNVSIDELKDSFIEFKKFRCKYQDCNHDKESDCNIKLNVLNNNILESRYNNYLQFKKEIYESSSKLYK